MQVVVVPLVGAGGAGVPPEQLLAAAEAVRRALSADGLRVEVDAHMSSPPGARFYAW